ncbi:MAG: PhzF family phenazine biosynthesis protein [Oscillospiraceae bacterium]|nr:PhzF family phenazine biosynthesis protein [Oscillospiraceae bacterium]
MKYYVVDVFTNKTFGGNPAGVCLLEEWLSDEILQSIAMENNLSETAFLVKRGDCYDLRWFTPEIEIDLCGHATMGGAYVLFSFTETTADVLRFSTQSGILTVERKGDMLLMDFPSRPAVPAPKYKAIADAFSLRDFEMHKSADLLVVLESEEAVRQARPDIETLKRVKTEAGMPDDSFGVIITAPGTDCDFVSRFFAPNAGINEDPVTGRAHCVLIPYWGKKLGKKTLAARQLSKRGGQIWCEDAGERVKIGGKVSLYLTGEIRV